MIYLDNAATTKPYPEVIEKIKEGLIFYGNPSSSHSLGKKSKQNIEIARNHVANLINCNPECIIFTSGGTESNNWSIYSQIANTKLRGVLTSPIEHHSILESLSKFKKTLGSVSKTVKIDENGQIKMDSLIKNINSNLALVSIMYANNEIGTIQPIKEIAEICKKHNVTMHTDGVQAIGKIPVDVKDLDIDLLSISAHKFHGPKGIGALYIKENTKMHPMIAGGQQELGLRAGTYNVPAIMGMGEAARIIKKEMIESKTKEIEEYFIKELIQKIPNIKINAENAKKIPGIINVLFPGIESKTFVLEASKQNIFCSSGSACNEGNNKPSHVLTAIGLSSYEAHSSVRFSLNSHSTIAEIDKTILKLPKILKFISFLN